MSSLHLPALHFSSWEADDLKHGPVDRRLHRMTDKLSGWKSDRKDEQTARQSASATAAELVRFIVILHSVRKGKRRRGGKKRQKESGCVCFFWWLASSASTAAGYLKKQASRERVFTRNQRIYRLERNRGGEQVSEILPFICLSFTPLCSLVVWHSDWFSAAGAPFPVGSLQSQTKQ